MKYGCTKCGEFKPASEFHRNKENEDGIASRCKQCVSEYYAGYSAKQDNPVKTGFHKCPSCNVYKPHTQFWRNKRKTNGLQSYCQTCQRVSIRRSQQKRTKFNLPEDKDYQCGMCNQFKPHTEFHLNKNRASGLQVYCKECRKLRYGY